MKMNIFEFLWYEDTVGRISQAYVVFTWDEKQRNIVSWPSSSSLCDLCRMLPLSSKRNFVPSTALRWRNQIQICIDTHFYNGQKWRPPFTDHLLFIMHSLWHSASNAIGARINSNFWGKRLKSFARLGQFCHKLGDAFLRCCWRFLLVRRCPKMLIK